MWGVWGEELGGEGGVLIKREHHTTPPLSILERHMSDIIEPLAAKPCIVGAEEAQPEFLLSLVFQSRFII